MPGIIFIIISILTIGSAMAVFFSKRLLHAVLALTLAFGGSALFFLYADQPFAAFLQLFILVGGLSTYLIVALASEESKGSFSPRGFVALLIIAAAVLSTIL